MILKKGFSLIELLVVIVIISILAAFAYPSYMEYVKRTKREEVKSEMLRIAQDLQSYRIINHTYATAVLDNDLTPLSTNYPLSNPLYTIELVPTAQTYTLTAMPKTGTTQDRSGVICIDHQGHKYWSKTVSTTVSCLAALSTTSSWAGR